MYFKIAINNVKKSFKDYALYFITLTLSVCIFYNFNSISSQTAMEDVNKIKALVKAISYISIFISIVFGGLIIYANNSLVKKRKKEFGIYATLGMSRKKISQILICETLIVGIISLILGLLIGIVLSQGTSILTGKLFEFNMTEYKFVMSISTISKTIIYFGIMFMIAIIFNTIVVSKQKLIDMINASKKNEDMKIRNPIISVIIFIASLIVLGTAYYLAWKFAPTPKNSNFPLSIPLGVLGTFLFFWGLSGFMLIILKKSKRIYLKKLNIFVVKQFNNKINTNFISMAVISLMLFLTILILSTGLSFKYIAEKGLKNIHFDSSITLNISDEKQKVQDIEEALKKVDFKLKDSYKYQVVDYYNTNIKVSNLLSEYANEKLKKRLKSYVGHLGVIKISQYNKMRKLKGESTIGLKENEVLILTGNEDENEALKKLMNKERKIKIGNKNYFIKNNVGIQEKSYNLTAVVHDDSVKNMIKVSSTININASEKDKIELAEKIKVLDEKFKRPEYVDAPNMDLDKGLKKYGFTISTSSKKEMYDNTKKGIGTLLYIGTYLGFVFLISSAAVLAIQELTEASDSFSRYRALKKIGVSQYMINKTIFTQILIHFMLPLGLALIHFAAALQVLNRASEYAFKLINVLPTITVTTGVIIAIYGIYFYATYLGYKSIVKNN
ncbi:FtsX-like permease family protein [Haloimpatiens sp. FM7330]|uniref:FtsX-like permease family protein n=1 Tax=Haloimpatiens sp. FM7330 TaxID=3298610 RepID=UPI003626C001